MLKEGAGLNAQNQQNLTSLLAGQDQDPNAVARAWPSWTFAQISGFVQPELFENNASAPDELFDPEEEDEEECAEDDIIQELEPLDLTEDQINKV